MDLKQPAGLALARALVSKADGLIEGFRPHTMERLQLGPEVCLQNNPRLIYGRVTGFGQDGPLAQAAGHDLNYIALSGALHGIGRAGAAPTPPLNLLGDYAGGSMFLAFGMVSAMLHARSTGAGQVVDAAMIDGVSALMTPFYGLHAAGIHDGPRGSNLLDSGAPYYDVYRCADGEYVSIAPIETKFQQILLDKLHLAGVDVSDWPDFEDRSSWSVLRGCFETTFAQRSRDDWCAVLEGSDACFAPVLSAREAPRHPHNQARRGFIDLDGITQPAPAPRFSATPASELPLPFIPDADAREWARAWGVAEIDLAAALPQH